MNTDKSIELPLSAAAERGMILQNVRHSHHVLYVSLHSHVKGAKSPRFQEYWDILSSNILCEVWA